MDFAFDMGIWAAAGLVVASVVFGVVVFAFGNPGFGYEWLLTAVGAFVGGFAASEFFVDLRAYEPVFDGMALIPALIGGIVVGGIVALAVRLVTREAATSSPT